MAYSGNEQFVFIGEADGTKLVSVGNIINGGSVDIESAVEELRGIGKSLPWEQRPALVTPGGSIEMFIKDKTPLLLGLRTNDKLSEFSVSAGASTEGKTHLYCKASSIGIDAEFKSPLKGKLEWKGMGVDEEASGQTQTILTNPTYMWYECKVSGIDLNVRAISIKVDNGLEVEGTLGEKTENIRLPEYIIETDQKIEVSIKAFGPLVGIAADDLAEISEVILTCTSGQNSLVIKAQGLLAKKESMPIKANDVVVYGIDYSARGIVIT